MPRRVFYTSDMKSAGIKEQILSVLSERAGEYVSGAELAAAAKVTRNAVWKAVNALVSGGADICRSHRGYMLRTAEVSEYGIKKRLPEEYSDAYIEVLDSVASTNTYMKGLAERAPDFSMTAAKEQTSGRGRYDRNFYSPRGSGVYFSVLLKDVDFERGGSLTALAAVAAAEAIEDVFGVEAGIKWVNDIYVRSKKCAGILTEAVTDMELRRICYAVIGIGVNVYEPEGGYPGGLKDVAGAAGGPDAPPDALNAVVAAIYTKIRRYYTQFDRGALNLKYRARSILDGKNVTVLKADGSEYPARVKGIDENFALAVIKDDGKEERLASGEVSLRLGKD